MWNLKWNDCGKLKTFEKRKPRAKEKKRSARAAPVISYAERAEVLLRLGFSSYREYLASKLWAKIRRRVHARDGGRCRICRDVGNEVHHQSYDDETMTGKSLRQLLLVCRKCHSAIEFDGNRKRDPAEARDEARAMLRSFSAEIDMQREFLRIFGRTQLP